MFPSLTAFPGQESLSIYPPGVLYFVISAIFAYSWFVNVSSGNALSVLVISNVIYNSCLSVITSLNPETNADFLLANCVNVASVLKLILSSLIAFPVVSSTDLPIEMYVYLSS